MKNEKKLKKKKKNSEPHPTLFMLEGTMQWFKDGSMLELHSKVSMAEWEQIVEETVKYRIFVNCLKEIFPKLHEQWTVEDEWFRLQMDVAVSRIRNLDPMLLLKYNDEEIKKVYLAKMNISAVELIDQIKLIRETHKSFTTNTTPDKHIKISNL